MDVSKYIVKESPPSIYYIPQFITEEEEQYLLNKIYSSPKPKWTQLAHRRLQNWGGLPHPKGMVAEALPEWLQTYVDKISQLAAFKDKKPNHVLVNEYLPGQGIMPHEDGPLFHPVVSTISLGSHTLLDFYHHRNNLHDMESGQHANEGMDRPTTGPEELEETSSTSNPRLNERYLLSILLERRSLVLVCDDMYTNHLHGIAEVTDDIISDTVANFAGLQTPVTVGQRLQRDTRVSLTIRHVPRTIKAKFLFGRR